MGQPIKFFLVICVLSASVMSAHSADIEWGGWSFDYSTNNNSSGLVLTDIRYNDQELISKVSMPVMRVEYENDVCGPYADILSNGALENPANGAQIAACNNRALCQRTFTQNGENLLEIGANWQIGEYQIYQTYYFSENGYFDSRVYSRGLQCQIQHSHHAHWMFDFDIDGSENDQIVRGEDDIQVSEFNDLKSNTDFWTIQDKLTGNGVRLTPAADDGEPGNFAKWDLAGRVYNSAEVGRWRNGARGEIGNAYNTPAQNIDGTDVVLWYVTHLPHSPQEGAGIWHASGPRIDVLDSGTVTPEPEPEPEPEPPQVPEPVIVNNVLSNGGFEEVDANWNNCGASDKVVYVTSNQAAGSRAMRLYDGGCLYQEAPASQNDSFELSCNVSRSGDEWAIVELNFLDANYQSLYAGLQQITHNGAYTNYSVSGTAPAGTVFVAPLLYSESNTYFDSCRLVPTNNVPVPDPDPADNILVNGDFENNLGGWYSCAESSLTSISTDSDTGVGALAVNGGGCMYQEFPIEPGKSYSMDCRAKTEGEDIYTSVTLSMLDVNYASLDREELPVLSAVYDNYASQLTAPANGTYGAVVVYSEDVSVFDNCGVSVN